MAFSINSRMAVIGKTYLRICPPTVYWHYKQWRMAGALDKLMDLLHSQVREQVKKKQNGRR